MTWKKRWAAALVIASVVMFGRVRVAAGQSAPQTMQPMAADADPSFAVATIKPSTPNEVVSSIPPVGYRTVLPMITVLKLVSFAYDVHNEQVVDAPQWIGSEKFDFVGVSDTPGRPDVKQLKTMLQKVLVDRFQLKFHWEKREMSAYALVLGKKGARLSRSKGDPRGMPTFFIKANGSASQTLTAKNVGVTELAHMLQSNVLDRPVVDQTGLQGTYDFVLTWAPDDSQFIQDGARAAGASGESDVPGIFTAMQEQLGLKLSAEKTIVPVMVVDRVEQPSPN
ncbi:MAG: TIGR03435 family protein [Acidobacteriaceae bacterium]